MNKWNCLDLRHFSYHVNCFLSLHPSNDAMYVTAYYYIDTGRTVNNVFLIPSAALKYQLNCAGMLSSACIVSKPKAGKRLLFCRVSLFIFGRSSYVTALANLPNLLWKLFERDT